MSRLTLSFIAAVLLVLATAGAALAKCPPGSTEDQCQGVVAEIDLTGNIQAGTETTVGLWLSHDGRPLTDTTGVELVFARVSDATVLRFPAAPTGTEGRYEARVELPAGGTWVIATEIRTPDGSYSMPLETLLVTNLPIAPADDPSPTPTGPYPIPTWGWAVLGAALLAGVIGMALIGRRRTATA